MSNKQNDIWNENMAEHKMGDHSDDFTDTRPCECNKPNVSQTTKDKDNEIWEDGYSFGIYKAREIIDELRKGLLKETTIGGHTIKVFDEIAKKIWLNKK